MAFEMARELSNRGFGIVSGMAMGIDKHSHLGALEDSNFTAAVLATDVTKPSPEINTNIYNKILEKDGLIISEFDRETPMAAGLFARRNRIVAGISLGSIIIEAGVKSGALITANLAFGYSKPVFAIPCSVSKSSPSGCNLLIKMNKAKLTENIYDILEEFGYIPSPVESGRLCFENMDEMEKLVCYAILSSPKYMDEIAKELKKDVGSIAKVCSILEIKGVFLRICWEGIILINRLIN